MAEVSMKYGEPSWIRTSDLCLRRAALYPAELWVHKRVYSLHAPPLQFKKPSREKIVSEFQCLDQRVDLVGGIVHAE